MMTPIVVAVAAASAAAAARAQGKGWLPPAPPPTWKDRLADVAFWALLLAPVLIVAACVGLLLFVIVKIAFLSAGLNFP